MKVSQGGDRGDRMNFFKYDWQKLDKSTVNNCFYDCKFYFIDFQTSSVILFEHR